ncbi:hypothetical protein AAA081_03620 [Aedoeadaptatus acetigenes]|uniref:DUF4366 domain-containing protein n=1 Tax=Aedoeadaptatus acetigenes TaxID=2981723 RepID=A0ABV1J5C2_9FIRM
MKSHIKKGIVLCLSMILIAQPIYASNSEIANKLKLYNNPSQNRYIEDKLKPESKKQDPKTSQTQAAKPGQKRNPIPKKAATPPTLSEKSPAQVAPSASSDAAIAPQQNPEPEKAPEKATPPTMAKAEEKKPDVQQYVKFRAENGKLYYLVTTRNPDTGEIIDSELFSELSEDRLKVMSGEDLDQEEKEREEEEKRRQEELERQRLEDEKQKKEELPEKKGNGGTIFLVILVLVGVIVAKRFKDQKKQHEEFDDDGFDDDDDDEFYEDYDVDYDENGDTELFEIDQSLLEEREDQDEE